VGLRPAEAGADPALLDRIVTDPLATVIRPAPLSAEATARFLREPLSPDAEDAFCAACREETGGNPLLLRELVHAIAVEGLAPTAANVPRLRELEARAGSRAVSLRFFEASPWESRLPSSSMRRPAPSWGAALRRANRRVAARDHLRRAVELATICGAASLAARAERELLATGARPRRVALSGVESLTPSERRVAELAAEGPTNREIAQALFVTQRTVEVHLTSIYRKLAINSRSQLAAALGEPAGV
jgi:DNA-binding CsgD family transcriptional regulator